MISDPDQRRRLLETFAFLRAGSAGFQSEFFDQVMRVRLPAGQAVCQAGAQCAHLPLVLDGTARVYQLGENGREITLYRVHPGESCVLTASCLLSARPFPAFAVCESAVEAVVVQPASVRRWLGSCEPWREYLFGLIAGRLVEVFGVLDAVLFQRLDQRLIDHLLRLAESLDASEIQATHQMLAAELGSSREVISRVLKGLEEQGLLRVRRGQIELLDRAELRRRTQDD
ncbi:Crp/Fnr family transcriptional regulator [Allochromatium vinosum]|uniref:Transcriptional regulator, Crp/Fnr family n=1 Tax=Allochromatium vinosum (strain ATCC 17899 / DSM 180 / NBRC 103801 / NCIMB 10441 / D) TaxID=572477 RepID=D3RS34_ALLVD|nr:Crp/Fnr family transcriptional regulator [Allochromatium vinosum]ADC63971.1 transcriptional regulator, Crp/Fnr family [Allochromatium vinosum DSM 180]